MAERSQKRRRPGSSGRRETEEAVLDAAERMLIQVGFANISTRTLAQEAGVNHGLIHYYFGSMEEVFVQVLERFTARITTRQRAMYGSDLPFLEKWRTAIGYIDQDLASGYPKVWFELEAMAWNRPEFRSRLLAVHEEWRAVLGEAVDHAFREYGIDGTRFAPSAMAALVRTFNLGVLLERLIGMRSDHDELFAMVDRWLVSLARADP